MDVSPLSSFGLSRPPDTAMPKPIFGSWETRKSDMVIQQRLNVFYLRACESRVWGGKSRSVILAVCFGSRCIIGGLHVIVREFKRDFWPCNYIRQHCRHICSSELQLFCASVIKTPANVTTYGKGQVKGASKPNGKGLSPRCRFQTVYLPTVPDCADEISSEICQTPFAWSLPSVRKSTLFIQFPLSWADGRTPTAGGWKWTDRHKMKEASFCADRVQHIYIRERLVVVLRDIGLRIKEIHLNGVRVCDLCGCALMCIR